MHSIERSSDSHELLPDGRQSQRALAMQRGVCRRLRAEGFLTVTELTLSSGRRADVVALGPTGEIWIVEIKCSVEDFRTDGKWPEYRLFCDRLFFASHADVPMEIFPIDAGFFLADAYDAELVRKAPEHKLPASTRRALTLSFARTAAARLHGVADPVVGGGTLL